MVSSAYQLHTRGHTPARDVNVLACLEQMGADGEHGTAPIDEVGNPRIVVYRDIVFSPPVVRHLFVISCHVLPLCECSFSLKAFLHCMYLFHSTISWLW